jgi:hypothetical protein
MGTRMMSVWKVPASLLSPRAAARDPNPIAAPTPLKAITAVQALCNTIKRRLVKLTTHICELARTSRGKVGVSEISFITVVVVLIAISSPTKSME